MHRSAEGNVVDAHVVLADVVALRMARAAAARPACAPGGSPTVRAITSLRDRRRRWSQVPPYFPGDAA